VIGFTRNDWSLSAELGGRIRRTPQQERGDTTTGGGAPDGLVTLWRPVGPAELELIAASGYRAFPPRLPEQPLFYPVLTEEYDDQPLSFESFISVL
jgi:hypothetical protein